MKLLLTSGGVTNPSIHAALMRLLGRPVGPAYAIDEQTAIAVLDGTVEVVSEGQWRKFEA